MTTIERTFCKCGCGQEVTGGKEYYNGTCRTRYHRQQKGKAGAETTQDVTGEDTAEVAAVMEAIEDQQTYRQIIDRCNSQFHINQAEQEQHAARIASINLELATLTSRDQARAQLLSTAATTLKVARLKSEDLAAQAVVTEGTAIHSELLAEQTAQKKFLARIEQENAALEKRIAEEQDQDAARRADLLAERQACNERMTEILSQNAALQRTKEQAFASIGDLEYKEIKAQVDAVKVQIEEQEQALQTLQETLKDVVRVGSTRLVDWSQHRMLIMGETEPEDNATSRIIRAALAYVELLISEGVNIDRHMRVPVAMNYYNWLELLTVPNSELYVEETLASPQRMLRRRAQLLRQLLDQYIATKR